MLLLFDIDATLLTTTRAGVLAVGDAGRDLYGPDFREDRVDYAGGLDPVIMANLLAAHGLPNSPDDVLAFRRAYGERLASRLADGNAARALPGVPELLDSLRMLDGITLGLLTGNFPETGRMKLCAAGIDPDLFDVQVWGCDSPHQPALREHLPPVGMARYHAMRGREIEPSRIAIIGDTIHDIHCARVHSCRSLGVATGVYAPAQLSDAGADRVVPDLTDTRGLTRWLTTMDP